MAMAARKSVTSLMNKTLERQATAARAKFKFSENQVEKILLSFVNDKNRGPYDELLKILKDYTLSDENFKMLLKDSLSCVVLLGTEAIQFIEKICCVEWADRTEKLVELFSRFVLSLVTAHNYHCRVVFKHLIKVFSAEGEKWKDKPSPEILEKWSNVHTVIAQIVAIMPMSSELLRRTLIDQFPYYKAGTYCNRAYVYNLIWMSKYIPLLQEKIVSTIICRMVIMDVNIADLKTKNKMETETYEGGANGEDDEQAVVTETLDYCMFEILKWLEEEKTPALNILCNVFERVILPTHGIRNVQFLLLYTISINQQCADRVLNNLWMIAAGLHGFGSSALTTRRTAISHLAGLLARCVRVPNTRLMHYLKTMADWCHAYITATQESSTASDNTKVHGAFHAICHSIFYLVAFKNHHLFMSKENLHFVESLNLPRLVTCNLNPLRTCPPQVTHAFSSVTRSHQVVYCQAIIDKNTRHTLQSTVVEQYDDWFPYDPYTLPISGKVIWPLCIEYKDFVNGDNETQYKSMKRKLEEDDDYLMLESPSRKLANSISNTILPGFRTSETVLI